MRWEQTVGLVRWCRFGPKLSEFFVQWCRFGLVVRFGMRDETWDCFVARKPSKARDLGTRPNLTRSVSANFWGSVTVASTETR